MPLVMTVALLRHFLVKDSVAPLVMAVALLKHLSLVDYVALLEMAFVLPLPFRETNTPAVQVLDK